MTKEKKKDQGCSCVDEACKIQQRIFEREVDEELQQEYLMNLWRKYRGFAFGESVGIFLIVLGFKAYRIWCE